MAAFFANDDEQTIFSVGLDDETVARLMELADAAKAPPALLIAAILRDVLEDDAMAHDPAPVRYIPTGNNDLH